MRVFGLVGFFVPPARVRTGCYVVFDKELFSDCSVPAQVTCLQSLYRRLCGQQRECKTLSFHGGRTNRVEIINDATEGRRART
jgi:hypothetical protein